MKKFLIASSVLALSSMAMAQMPPSYSRHNLSPNSGELNQNREQAQHRVRPDRFNNNRHDRHDRHDRHRNNNSVYYSGGYTISSPPYFASPPQSYYYAPTPVYVYPNYQTYPQYVYPPSYQYYYAPSPSITYQNDNFSITVPMYSN